ncbi:MAG: NAD(P)-binding domain-containing protein [Planctomycetota bacterium]
MRVLIIGLGHIGHSIGQGLVDSPFAVVGCDRNPNKVERFTRVTGFEASDSWKHLLKDSDVIMLSVRTDQVNSWIDEAREALASDQILVCLSAGINLRSILDQLGPSGVAARRAIANINVAVRSGCTVLMMSEDAADSDPLVPLFEYMGQVIQVGTDEELDRLSVLPGCAPGGVALFLEGLVEFGVRSGFSDRRALELALASVEASAAAMRQLDIPPVEFKRYSASPGGFVDRLLDDAQSHRVGGTAGEWFDHILRHLTGGRPSAESK